MCKHKSCITTKKPCEAVEGILRQDGIKSADWIRPKMASDKRGKGSWREIPFSMLNRHEWNKKLNPEKEQEIEQD